MTPVPGDPDDILSGQDVAVCPSCGERNLARAKFCMECGARMAVESGERRLVSVVFADLSGFTSYSETVDPEAVRALADEAAHGLGSIVERYGGTVDKIIGDCVMAIFGAPIAHEDDAERAVRAALDMQSYVTDHSDRFAGLKLSVGVHTGEAVYAPVGPSGSYTVLGDTVNTAARLQGAADKGEVLIGDPTARAAGAAITVEEIPPIVAKNKRDPVTAWRAVGIKGQRASRTLRKAPLIGRALELSRLLERWEVARTDRHPQLVSVLGSPGVGKSRLVETFLERASDTALVHRGRCLDYGDGITYWPFIEMIRDASGIRHDDETAVVSHKLGTLLETLGSDDLDELRTMAVAVANIVDAPTTPRGTYRAERISRAELHWGLRRIFELLARQRPIVMVIEDLHWAEPTLLELLEFFLHADDGVPLMVLCTSRPELKDSHPQFCASVGRRRGIELEPLNEEDAQQLLREMVGEEGAEAMQPLLRSAAGNPLFLEEIVRMLTDYGVLDEKGRPSGGPIDQIPVPSSLTALIGSRLDRLSASDRQIAGDASVIGETFWLGAVEFLHSNGTDIPAALGVLTGRDIVRPQPTSTMAGESEYAFGHALMREVAYQRIPKARRARLHERCGDWIARATGGDDDHVEFVAYHLEQACRLARDVGRSAGTPPVLRAVTALKRAGNKAMNREGLREAERFFARALDVVGDGFPEVRAEVALSRARALWSLGQMDEALDSMAQIAGSAEQLGRVDLQTSILLDLAVASLARGRVEDAGTYLRRAEQAAGADADAETRANISMCRAQFRAAQQGDPAHAVEELGEAIAIADADGLDAIRFASRLRLGTILLNAGELDPADETLLKAAEIAKADGSVRSQAMASTFLAYTRFCRGPREDADGLASQTVGWLKRLTGHGYYLGQALQTLGMSALMRGDTTTAEEYLREALAVTEPIGGRVTAEIGRHLTEVVYRQGRARDTQAIAAEVIKRAPERDPGSRAYATICEAFIAAADGDPDIAKRRFADALLLLEELRMAIELAYTRVSAAWAFRRLGLLEDAADQLALAKRAAGSMGAKAILEDAEREEAALLARD